jgi:hypothetical protein
MSASRSMELAGNARPAPSSGATGGDQRASMSNNTTAGAVTSAGLQHGTGRANSVPPPTIRRQAVTRQVISGRVGHPQIEPSNDHDRRGTAVRGAWDGTGSPAVRCRGSRVPRSNRNPVSHHPIAPRHRPPGMTNSSEKSTGSRRHRVGVGGARQHPLGAGRDREGFHVPRRSVLPDALERPPRRHSPHEHVERATRVDPGAPHDEVHGPDRTWVPECVPNKQFRSRSRPSPSAIRWNGRDGGVGIARGHVSRSGSDRERDVDERHHVVSPSCHRHACAGAIRAVRSAGQRARDPHDPCA